MSKQSVRYTIHFLTAVSITAMVLFVIYGMQNGLFTDRTKMEMLIEREESLDHCSLSSFRWYKW